MIWCSSRIDHRMYFEILGLLVLVDTAVVVTVC
jgi:hypothetical protein